MTRSGDPATDTDHDSARRGLADTVRLVDCVGPAIEPYLDAVAALRIEVFREFPYLYDGDVDYERRYLATYANSSRALVVVAINERDEVVGASTAVPLADEVEAFRRPFERAGIVPATVFYLAESVLRRPWRGRGLGGRFFDHREAHARRLGGFELAAFCAVDRPADHPLRPPGYRPLDAFWQRRGYTRRPDLTTTFSWKQIDENEETPKRMTFWTKPIGRV